MNKLNHLGRVFRDERKKQGKSVHEVARIIDVAPGSIYNFERGDVERPSFDLVAALAVALDMSLDALIFSKNADNDRFLLRQQLTQIQSAISTIAHLTGVDSHE